MRVGVVSALFSQKAQRADHEVLTERLGARRDAGIREFAATNVVDMFQRQLALLFGHHRDSYVFGNGVHLFPAWFASRHPGVRMPTMERQVRVRVSPLLGCRW